MSSLRDCRSQTHLSSCGHKEARSRPELLCQLARPKERQQNHAFHIAFDQRECHKAGDHQLKALRRPHASLGEVVQRGEETPCKQTHGTWSYEKDRQGSSQSARRSGQIFPVRTFRRSFPFEPCGGHKPWEELLKYIGFEITGFAPTIPTEFAKWLVITAPIKGWDRKGEKNPVT